MRLDNPLVVQWEYASEERLSRRNQTYRDLVEGQSPEDVAFAAVAEARPLRFLEIGCGIGQFAKRVLGELHASVVSVDVADYTRTRPGRIRGRLPSTRCVSLSGEVPEELPAYELPLRVKRASSIFVAEKAS